MKYQSATVSLIGDREINQDRMAVVGDETVALAIVVDGMGGHSEGEMAAEATLATLIEHFEKADKPIFDPRGFLHDAIVDAHDRVVALGKALHVDQRPRATCVACLIQKKYVYWIHVGDARAYHIRDGKVIERTRDHTHIENLLREGLISESEVAEHPLRSFVEFCIGGDPKTPAMSIAGAKRLQPHDVMLLCSDGLWSGVTQDLIAKHMSDFENLQASLDSLCNLATTKTSPRSDNATGCLLHWIEHEEKA